eukprot:2137024-Amphidinium_carterae.1
MAAVEQDGDALQYAAEDLKGDHAIVLAAVEKFWCALKYAADALLLDDEFASEAKRNGLILKIYMASGRYTCQFVEPQFETTEHILATVCEALGIPSTGNEVLLSGTD